MITERSITREIIGRLADSICLSNSDEEERIKHQTISELFGILERISNKKEIKTEGDNLRIVSNNENILSNDIRDIKFALKSKCKYCNKNDFDTHQECKEPIIFSNCVGDWLCKRGIK